MSISADMMLTKPRTVQLRRDNELVTCTDSSMLTITAKGGIDRTFRLSEPWTQGQFLALIWGDNDHGTLKSQGPLRLCGDWLPARHDTLFLVASTGGWFELARSANSKGSVT